MKKQSTEQFIIEAKEKHADKYDYSKVVYENNLKEVIIICKEHGEFLQIPKTHKRGNGCKDCGREKTINGKKSNTNDFIKKSNIIHNNKYDYSKVEYIKANQKVIIICQQHGDFLQTPNSHLSKESGCRNCSTEINSDKQRKTTNQFITDAIKIHGDTYNYSKVKYKNAGEKIIIICKEHGDFLQTPNSHLNGNGCYKCGYNMFIFSNNDFINKAKEIHNDKYDYSKINYIKMNEKVIIVCKEHGDFEQTPSNHITHKEGCQKCVGNYLSNSEEFIEKAKLINNYKY